MYMNNTSMYYNLHEQHVYVLQFTWTTRVCTTIHKNSTFMYYNIHEQHVYVHVLQFTSTARVCTTMYMINSHAHHVHVLQFTWTARKSTIIYLNKTCMCHKYHTNTIYWNSSLSFRNKQTTIYGVACSLKWLPSDMYNE